MQRDRAPTSYEDPEARYERRPSAWVEPRGKWGAGRVELVQIPTPDETNDNIVAYWVPSAAPAPGSRSTSPIGCAGSCRARCRPPRAGWCRRGAAAASPSRPDGDLNFVVDFDGPTLRKLAADCRASRR